VKAEILRFEFTEFYDSQVPLEEFITTKAPEELKKAICKRLFHFMISEGFPAAMISSMNESIVTDNIGRILQPMISYTKLTMNRNDFIIILTREKQIIGKRQTIWWKHGICHNSNSQLCEHS
jgi:hypothetical protein